MAWRSFNSFSVLSLAIFGAVLLSQGLVEARGSNDPNPFCHKAVYFQLCDTMVGDAKTLKEASINAIKSTRVLASEIPALTKAVTQTVQQHGKLDAKSKEQVIKQCNEVFETAVDNLDLALGAVEADDTFTAATKLSAVNFEGCSDALEQFGMTLPMDKVVKDFDRQVSNSLAVVQAPPQ